MIYIKETVDLLGLKAKDKVTGFTGVITSVSFDLYGCVQVILNPGTDKDGKMGDSLWFDVARLEILSRMPVMDVPSFEYEHGPESKSTNGW